MTKNFRKCLMIGLAAAALSTAAPAWADQVLNIAHPALEQSWSPLQGGGHVARWQSLGWAAPKHFDKDGKPTETLLAAKQDRLENWRLLQELAGLR